jgi:diguanylate cyclase (GGDEF)-like protein
MKILVVDDSKSIRQIVAECVKTLGHDVAYAENGQQCLEYVAQNAVDLILMDVEMPHLNGVEATKALRGIKNADWFPIIFLTSHSDDDSFVNGILAGGDAYLAKPISPLRLQLTVVAMERIYVMRQKLYKAQNELQRVNKELERLSFFDQLTGMANRRHFDLTIEKQFALSRRNRTPLSLLMCDIDYFKLYNDSYGHQHGDSCLAAVGQHIAAQVMRPTDLACRYGGEEFAVILPDTALQGAAMLAEKIRAAVFSLALPHSVSQVASVVSLSLGVATQKGQFQNFAELIKTADSQLYRAKQLGRNRVEVSF